MPHFDILTITPAAAVSEPSGTMTFAYPAGRTQHSYVPTGSRIWVEGHERLYDQHADNYEISYGASNITVTWKADTDVPAGQYVRLEAPVYHPDVFADAPRLPVFTVANAPAAAKAGAGAVAYFSNGAAGDPVLAFSNGTNWLRSDTRATVAAS